MGETYRMHTKEIRNENTISILQSEVTKYLADLSVDGRKY